MKIAYLGPISLSIIKPALGFDTALPESRLKYAHGARLVLELLKRGHEVIVITPCESVPRVRRISSGRCILYLIPQRRTRYQLLTCHHREVSIMVDCLAESQPDVAFAQWLYMYSRAALLSGIPTLVVGRDSPWRIAHLMRTFRMWHRAIYSKIFVAPRLRNLTTISPHMVGDLRMWWGVDREISVIPNAIPDGVVSETDKVIRDAATTIACVTDWNELKNVKTLLRAFVSLHERHPEWRLVVYGASILPDGEAGNWMLQNGLSFEGVDLRGYGKQEDIRQFMLHEADVFCSPSLEESFGMVFLEAMAQGVPCVGGEKSGAVPWVLGVEREWSVGNGQWSVVNGQVEKKVKVEGEGGVVCDVTRPEKLAECLERVMLDYELRKRLSDGGRRRVFESFNMPEIVNQYEVELSRIARSSDE